MLRQYRSQLSLFLISEFAIQAKAHALPTVNARHFRHLDAAGVSVVVPGTRTLL
jgi:hypothetical protein